jgi:hypothetical protein
LKAFYVSLRISIAVSEMVGFRGCGVKSGAGVFFENGSEIELLVTEKTRRTEKEPKIIKWGKTLKVLKSVQLTIHITIFKISL